MPEAASMAPNAIAAIFRRNQPRHTVEGAAGSDDVAGPQEPCELDREVSDGPGRSEYQDVVAHAAGLMSAVPPGRV